MREEEFELIGDKSSFYIKNPNSSLEGNSIFYIKTFARWANILASTITTVSLMILPFFYFYQDALRILTIIIGSSYCVEIFAFI